MSSIPLVSTQGADGDGTSCTDGRRLPASFISLLRPPPAFLLCTCAPCTVLFVQNSTHLLSFMLGWVGEWGRHPAATDPPLNTPKKKNQKTVSSLLARC